MGYTIDFNIENQKLTLNSQSKKTFVANTIGYLYFNINFLDLKNWSCHKYTAIFTNNKIQINMLLGGDPKYFSEEEKKKKNYIQNYHFTEDAPVPTEIIKNPGFSIAIIGETYDESGQVINRITTNGQSFSVIDSGDLLVGGDVSDQTSTDYKTWSEINRLNQEFDGMATKMNTLEASFAITNSALTVFSETAASINTFIEEDYNKFVTKYSNEVDLVNTLVAKQENSIEYILGEISLIHGYVNAFVSVDDYLSFKDSMNDFITNFWDNFKNSSTWGDLIKNLVTDSVLNSRADALEKSFQDMMKSMETNFGSAIKNALEQSGLNSTAINELKTILEINKNTIKEIQDLTNYGLSQIANASDIFNQTVETVKNISQIIGDNMQGTSLTDIVKSVISQDTIQKITTEFWDHTEQTFIGSTLKSIAEKTAEALLEDTLDPIKNELVSLREITDQHTQTLTDHRNEYEDLKNKVEELQELWHNALYSYY